MSSPPRTPDGAVRIVVCDYNTLLQSITGLLRMSGYCVFQAYDGLAAQELCYGLPNIGLLVLNTEGTGADTPEMVHSVRKLRAGLPVLHIGKAAIPGMPEDVLNLPETFSADQVLAAVQTLVPEKGV